MPFPDGSPLDDLLPSDLPQVFQSISDRFTTDGVTSDPFAGGTQHRGTLRPQGNGPLDLGIGTLHLPGVSAGVPFRLAVFDAPQGRFHLDLVLDGISLTLNDLVGADFLPEQGTVPQRLVRRTQDTDVVIQGNATLRFARASGDAAVTMLFVDPTAAADPLADTGAVVTLTCTPPHFFLGRSQFAMTLSQLVFDASDLISPPLVTEAGQGAEWMGFAIAEATVYAPPNAIGRGGFSGGVRNLLLGSPRGVQGEFEVQWGRTPLNPDTFVFTQDGLTPQGATGGGNSRIVAITGDQDARVTMAVALVQSSPPDTGSWTATWHWPDGSVSQGTNAAGQVGHGQVLRVIPQEQPASGQRLSHPEIAFRFVASGDVPEIDVLAGANRVNHVAHLAGPAADLAALQLLARSTGPTPGAFEWLLLPDGAPQSGASLRLDQAVLTAADAPRDRFLLLRETDAQGRRRQSRLRVQVTDAPLLIGGTGGVVAATDPTAPLVPDLVETSFDLADFHARGDYLIRVANTRLDPSRPGGVALPDGILAQVTFDRTVPLPDPAPAPQPDRHVQLLFEFAKGEVREWGPLRPSRDDLTGTEGMQAQLQIWAANYPGADFVMVGRCDDLGGDALNLTLARDRVQTALTMLTTPAPGGAATPVDPARVRAWGEQSDAPGDADLTPLTHEERQRQRLILATDDVTDDPLVDRTGWPPRRDEAHESEGQRRLYRRVDVYAIGGTPAAASTRLPRDQRRDPDLRRMLMPGANADPVPAPLSTPADDKRVRLLIAWDKPTASGWRDLIPSKAEFDYAWSPVTQPLPPLGGQPVDMGQEVLTVYGAWTHDDATDFTRSQIGIRSDGDADGLIRIDQPTLVAAMALGPMLLSEVDSDSGTIENAARIGALAAGTAFATTLLGDQSRAIVKTIEARAEFDQLSDPGQGWKVSLVSDYTTVLHVDTGQMGLSTDPDHPVKFRYKKVGVRYDSRAPDFWDQIGLEYPTDAMEVEDPGKWRIDGPLRDLLRAVETALGLGSLWIETRFAFALSIGVVEISEAVIRVTFTRNATPIPDVDFSLRGLTARVNIPATLTGEGRLRIEDGGVIRAGIELDVIPLQLKASAAFAMAAIDTPQPYTFVSLYAKVQFPVGIPLGPSGAAIHGFVGMTAINGRRSVGTEADIVAREIGWWGKAPERKYDPEKGQHALGLGAVVGTLPDASFSLSAQGMIVVAFPDPEVIFGVEVNLLSLPDRTAKETGGGQSAAIIGLVVIDDQAVSMAISARYDIPKILSVVAPFAAYFPKGGTGTYIRLGSDGQHGRAGQPVTLTLLPDTLNLRAFAYLMIQQNGIHRLADHPDFTFHGFSVGFGAGAGLEWRAGPIRLSASVLLLAGFGTDPVLIKAGIFVRGELDLVVVSIAARGEIVLTYQDGALWMDGEFCGRVDLFFFSISGCVRFRIGNPAIAAPKAPPPPAVSVVLTDRFGRIMGEAAPDGTTLQGKPLFRLVPDPANPDLVVNKGADPRDNHTVWADTAPVINFRHFIRDAIPPGQQFDPPEQPSAEAWFGSNRLKYAYRMDGLRLIRARDGAAVTGPRALASAWTTSPARQPGSAGPLLPSGAEVTSLKLLDWQPWGWALPMTEGGEGHPGDPADTIARLCQPTPRTARACLKGRDARAAGPHRIRLLHETPPPGPYPSRFTLTGEPGMPTGTQIITGAAMISLVAAAGGVIRAGEIADLPQPVAGPDGPLTQGYRLPQAQGADIDRVTRASLPWMAQLDRPLRAARLLMLVCDGNSRPPRAQPRRCFGFDGLTLDSRHARLDLPAFTLLAANASSPFLVTDKVTATQGNPMPGSDGHPDILIAPPGLIVRPRIPARIIELHLLRTERQGLRIEWTDSEGRTDALPSPDDDLGALVLRIEARADITQIRLETKAHALHLYRICVLDPDAQRCFDFATLDKGVLQQPAISHAGVRFTTIDPTRRMFLQDSVDLSAGQPRKGQDNVTELAFPDTGIEMTPDTPWTALSIGVLSQAGPVTARGFDADGKLVSEASSPATAPVDLHLAAEQGIARVIVTGGSSEAAIFRICETRADGPVCHDLGDLKPGRPEKLSHRGLIYAPADGPEPLEVVDIITPGDPIRHRPDGRSEMLVPSAGLRITPETPVAGLTLHLVPLADTQIEATAIGLRGAVLAQATAEGKAEQPLTLTIEAEGAGSFQIRAGDKTLLLRVCPIAHGDTSRGKDRALPSVLSRKGSAWTAWDPTDLGQMTDATGRACRLLAHDQPAALTDIDDLLIVSPEGRCVTLISLCGVDAAAMLARDQDEAARQALTETTEHAASSDVTAAARQILLDPGEEYRIEIDWRWQPWESNAAGTNQPPPVPADTWTPAISDPPLRQVFRFRVADQDLAGGQPDDGLNEYRFDPRDLARYVARTEPVDGRDTVFTDDPIWIHFNSGHVEQLVARHGRKLVIEVRRTDPPPRPASAGPAGPIIAALIETFRLWSPDDVLLPAERRINAAVRAAACLPDGDVAGGLSLGGLFALEPRAMYDMRLLAPRLDDSDPVVVHATRFVTSRHANAPELLTSLGFPRSSRGPLPPADLILAPDAVLPVQPLEVSDAAMARALTAIGADTLPPPDDQAQVIALWRALPGGLWGVAGVLIDAPEPMRRDGAVRIGNKIIDGLRCAPSDLGIQGANRMHMLHLVRATRNWTRVLYAAPTPITPRSEAEMRLRFEVMLGLKITGRRLIGPRPVLLETEGF